MKIGIISDTHGIFREEWHRYLDSCDYLIHAGDFCTQKNYDCFLELWHSALYGPRQQ